MSIPDHHQCNTLPPVQATYTPKGTWGELAGIKTYFTGPEDTGKALLFVYDVFGYSPQILQGADILSTAGYRIAIPDFLDGQYVQSWWGNGSKEGVDARTAFRAGYPGKPATQDQRVADTLAALKSKGYTVGAAGFCWGWKAVVLSQAVNGFSAIATAHPSAIDPDDADRVAVPVLLLPSAGEPRPEIEALYARLEAARPGTNKLKWYDESVHGWAAARADLSDAKQADKFKEAYEDFAEFFKLHL